MVLDRCSSHLWDLLGTFLARAVRGEREREITIRPRNASKVDGTHLELNPEVLRTQTKASTNRRPQPSDSHVIRTISWWNVHPERYEHIAVEYYS